MMQIMMISHLTRLTIRAVMTDKLRMTKKLGMRLCLFIGLVFTVGVAVAAPTFPELSSHVVDQTGLLSFEKKQDIANKLVGLEQQSSVQFVVAIVTSLEGYEIREYGIMLARHWELGQKDLNNGVLLLVAPNERKVSIEVGYGLEGTLTDALSFSIIQDYILPKFRQGEMGAGIELGAQMILQGLAGEIDVQSLQSTSSDFSDDDILTIIFVVVMFLIVIFIIVGSIRNPGGVSVGGSSSRSSSSSSWSGSSGGFSGGGGSFGGGGASGGW